MSSQPQNEAGVGLTGQLANTDPAGTTGVGGTLSHRGVRENRYWQTTAAGADRPRGIRPSGSFDKHFEKLIENGQLSFLRPTQQQIQAHRGWYIKKMLVLGGPLPLKNISIDFWVEIKTLPRLKKYVWCIFVCYYELNSWLYTHWENMFQLT